MNLIPFHILPNAREFQSENQDALANIEAEDTAIATLKFKNGALGLIEATTATRPIDLEGSLSILGEKGTVEVSGFAANRMQTWKFEDERESDKHIFEEFLENPQHKFGYAHKKYYEHVVDCINKDSSLLVGGIEGKKSLKLINAIYRSIETNKEIFLDSDFGSSRLGKN